MTKTYLRISYPGSFVSEQSISEVKNRSMPTELPKGYFSFNFYDQEEINQGGEKLMGKPKNYSKEYYPGGRLMTLAEVKAEVPNSKILQSNMECNEWDKVIKTRRGNFQPYDAAKNEVIADI